MTELNNAIAHLGMPKRIARLPVSSRGFPVPWFVAHVNGDWDFRVIAPGKTVQAIRQKRCWICGDVLGSYLCFVVGPMCTVSRTSAEPPSHAECGQYAAIACPFLTNPRMRRNEKDMHPDKIDAPGQMILRNPGVTALWITKSYRLFNDGNDGVLIEMGDPTNVTWYAEGRPATRAEVDESMRTGMPALDKAAQAEGADAVASLSKYVESAKRYLPAA
jgi:hypothetical protein